MPWSSVCAAMLKHGGTGGKFICGVRVTKLCSPAVDICRYRAYAAAPVGPGQPLTLRGADEVCRVQFSS